MASLNPLTGALGQRRAAHLLRRTSYRFTKAKVDEMAAQTPAQALASLLTLYPRQLDQPVYQANAGDPLQTWINPVNTDPMPAEDFILRRYVMGWWVNEALLDPGIGHKMAFFYHQYNIVTANTATNRHFYDYLELMRWGALGNFKKLAAKVIFDNCMLRYLNNNENTANNPNENFAREFLELFTIGKGPQIAPGNYSNYTEDDIVAAARVFTGIRFNGARNIPDPETGIPRGSIQVLQHDSGPKTFCAELGGLTIPGGNSQATIATELSTFVNMVFSRPETAKNLCRRLYRYFVYRNISDEVENDIIAPLAAELMANGYEVKPILEKLLSSEHFYDLDDADASNEIVGGMIKSPMELALQSMTFFNVPIPSHTTQNAICNAFFNQSVITRMFGIANFPIFFAPDVAGYPGLYKDPEYSRQWFNSSSIIARYKLGAMLTSGRNTIGGNANGPLGTKLNSAQWLKTSGTVSDPSDPEVLVQELLEYMLPEQVDANRFNYFYNTVFLNGLPANDWTYEWQNYLSSNNPSEVTIALDRLIQAIMYSPEFQTF
jgi:uncharacterized protein (DUF1800 family)